VARQDRLLVNNLLANRPNPPSDAFLPAADLKVETPQTGTVSFECANRALFDLVAMYLQAEYPSGLMDLEGGRAVHVAAAEEVVPPDRFPARVSIPVEIVHDPGPVEL
jgi:hypothetical protein